MHTPQYYPVLYLENDSRSLPGEKSRSADGGQRGPDEHQ